jgi:chemotaxis protein methyltransferase CheR
MSDRSADRATPTHTSTFSTPRVSLGPLPEVRPISGREFHLLQHLIEQESGIHLHSGKKALLVGRLSRRLRELRLASFGAYYRLLREDEGERSTLVERICTHETAFFRESGQFELLERQVLPAWSLQANRGDRPRRIRAWCAGCSTGEEPYSLAMVLLAQFPRGSGWELEITATDVSASVLKRARSGIWPLEGSDKIPDPHLKRFMLRGIGSRAGTIKAGKEIRKLIRFEQLNLSHDTYAVRGRFDLIFCRNVLIYFHKKSRLRVIDRLLGHLESSGLLFLGHAESLWGHDTCVRSVIPAVYALGNKSGSRCAESAAGERALGTTCARSRG